MSAPVCASPPPPGGLPGWVCGGGGGVVRRVVGGVDGGGGGVVPRVVGGVVDGGGGYHEVGGVVGGVDGGGGYHEVGGVVGGVVDGGGGVVRCVQVHGPVGGEVGGGGGGVVRCMHGRHGGAVGFGGGGGVGRCVHGHGLRVPAGTCSGALHVPPYPASCASAEVTLLPLAGAGTMIGVCTGMSAPVPPSTMETAVALAPPDPGAGDPGTVGALPSAVLVHGESESSARAAPALPPSPHSSRPNSIGILKPSAEARVPESRTADPTLATLAGEAALTGDDAKPAAPRTPWVLIGPWFAPKPTAARAGE